jgi:hypothetical protein
MFYTKKWGIVSSKAELYMLVNAEHKFEEKREKEQYGQKGHLHMENR